MNISTKFIIEFCTQYTTEIIAICDSLELVKEYMNCKFQIDNIEQNNKKGCLIYIELENAEIKVRKLDVVEN